MAFSELKVYSIGIAAENLKLGNGPDKAPNRILEVTPIEDSPMLDGEINSDHTEDQVKSEDVNGGQEQIKTKSANSVKASWLPLGSSNRFTPPNVRRGERVVLYRYSDEDKFYWTTLFDDLKLRKLETVIYAFSGTQDENDQSITPDSYYFLEVSTHKGLVHFHTSKKNGEFCSYDLQINPKDGLIKIEDDMGNLFIFDSQEKQIAMKNADDNYMEINKKNTTFNVPETLTIKAKNVVQQVNESIKTEAGNSISEKTGSYSMDASGSISEKAGGSMTHKASGSITIDGSGVKISKGVAIS